MVDAEIVSGSYIQFTPAEDFYGKASFVYTVTDNGTTNSDMDPRETNGFVSFTITEVNDNVVAQDDHLEAINENSNTLVIPFVNLTSNDSKGSANENDQTLTITHAMSIEGGYSGD